MIDVTLIECVADIIGIVRYNGAPVRMIQGGMPLI